VVRVAEGIEQRAGSLRLHIRWKGQRVTETHPGRCDNAHIRQVVRRREWLLSRLRVGLPIYEEDTQQLGLLFDSYLATLSVKRSTLRSYENIYKVYWSHWGSLIPQAITRAMILAHLSQVDVSPKTKRNALAVLSSTLRHADVSPNPCDNIRIKRHQKAPVERYMPHEVDTLLSKLSGEQKVYFTVMAATGMRPGEILGLEWSDWDGERLDVSKQIVRRRLVKSTKTSVRRRVYVPVWARDTLNNHATRFRGGYIFQNKFGSHHCDTDVFNGAWKRAHEKARIPYRIPYTLRHTRAAELLSGQVSHALAAKELGHSVQMFLSTYSEFIEEYSTQDASALDGVRRTRGQDERVG
jgi:integrase